MKSNYDLLVSKINEFTQKFYLNKLLKGSIYTLALLLGLYLALFVLVYYMNPPVPFKTALFFSYMATAMISIVIWVVRPALLYFNLNKNLSIEQAAELIGSHFFNVRDKLLNTLQLKELADQNPGNNLLIMAGIDQKILELNPIPFTSAVKLAENRKYIKYFLIPLSVILLIALIAPAVLREGTYSFVQYNREVLPPAPFRFELLNDKMRVSQGDDLTLRLKMTGDKIPQDIYLSDGVNSYKLEKENNTRFRYTFKNLQKDKTIRFTASGFNSASHVIEVRPRPSVLGMVAKLRFPAYLGKPEELVQNAGDLVLPEGTAITWQLRTENSSSITFLLGGKVHLLAAENNVFNFSSVLKQDLQYQVIAKNSFVDSKDSITHQISIVKDEFPAINLTETPDSVSKQSLYFSGKISDDHGFSALRFCYEIKEAGALKNKITKTLAIKKNQMENAFFLYWKLSEAQLKTGQTLEYYFEVADNDGVNGPKITKSDVRVFEAPSPQQVSEQLERGSSALKQQMEKAIKLAGQVEKESKKLGETLLDKKQLSFDDKKQVEQLLDKQKELEEAVKEVKDLNQKNNLDKEENKLLKEEMLEKQKQIDNLFNNVLDEKTKELLEKLQNLMDQENKDQTQNELSRMQMDNKSLKNELDRILELYKQLEFEQNLKNNINRLNDLAKKQQEQAEKTKLETSDPKSAKEEQQKLSSDFNDIKKELEKLQEKNQELERPSPYSNPGKESRQVQEQQKESENKLNEGKKKDAAENQQKAAEQMKQMAADMEKMQSESAETESKVNAEELRQLLENLLNTSFDQEKVMLNLKAMSSSDPQYTVNVQKQRSIKDNMKTIADSLFSLSKRVPQIETAVNEEMQKINFNIDKSLEGLGERNTGSANRNQQYTMTSINNLALMLNEALSQLQKSMKNAKSGGKGSSGKQNMSELQKMQQQLNNNMQKAKEQMDKAGNKGSVGKGQMSQEFARMAQQQQMIREALQKINREENKDGKGKLGNLNQLIQDMKSTENELVNKKLEQETMNRQKNLMLKMLEAENSERDQEQDAKREAKAAKDFPPSYRQMLEKFKRAQQTETEWLQKLPPSLSEYYKNKIAAYFKLLNSTPQK
jgi:ABC-type sugar transport system permease subunit